MQIINSRHQLQHDQTEQAQINKNNKYKTAKRSMVLTRQHFINLTLWSCIWIWRSKFETEKCHPMIYISGTVLRSWSISSYTICLHFKDVPYLVTCLFSLHQWSHILRARLTRVSWSSISQRLSSWHFHGEPLCPHPRHTGAQSHSSLDVNMGDGT